MNKDNKDLLWQLFLDRLTVEDNDKLKSFDKEIKRTEEAIISLARGGIGSFSSLSAALRATDASKLQLVMEVIRRDP